MKRRLRLDLAYDGSAYAGWQMQHNAPTVQEMLERALARINGDRRVVVHGAGRTDSGVHARQQVCDFVLDSPMNDDDIAHALAKLLPDDIRPLRVGSVDDSFHAQFSATAKSYRYQLDLSRYGDPLQARYAWHLRKPLDQAAIDAALTWIPGEKDWSGFAGSKCTVVSKVRDVTDATFDRDGDRGFFHFRANGFLTYMVRNLVGTLVYVGLGRLEPEVVAQMIETQDRALGGPGAPGYGLHLWSVEYGTSLR